MKQFLQNFNDFENLESLESLESLKHLQNLKHSINSENLENLENYKNNLNNIIDEHYYDTIIELLAEDSINVNILINFNIKLIKYIKVRQLLDERINELTE